MAKHKLGNANRKRYFARFYLDAISQLNSESGVLNSKALIRAHQESCLFHLVMAYRSFIWEVANTYDEPYDGSGNLRMLLEQTRSNGKTLPELERLEQLETHSGSWLHSMLACWQRISDVNPEATTTAKAAVNLNAIEVRVFSEEDEFSQLHDWYDNLCNTIDEIRDLLGEW